MIALEIILKEYGITDGKSKRYKLTDTYGSSQIALIRVRMGNSLTLETRDSAPIFQSL